jgi:hypothetical protein
MGMHNDGKTLVRGISTIHLTLEKYCAPIVIGRNTCLIPTALEEPLLLVGASYMRIIAGHNLESGRVIEVVSCKTLVQLAIP